MAQDSKSKTPKVGSAARLGKASLSNRAGRVEVQGALVTQMGINEAKMPRLN